MNKINFIQEASKYLSDAIDTTCALLKYKTVLEKFDENSQYPFGIENKLCLEEFLNIAQKDGFKTFNASNYAGHIEFGSGDELVGVLAHLDVVPALEDDWNSDPFTPTIKDGRIYARGSMDDKGPAVAAYYAIKILKDLGVTPTKRVRLIVGCDEESGSRCLSKYFETEEMPSLGFSPDAEYPLIYGEKSFQNFILNIDLTNTSIKSWQSGSRTNIVPDSAILELNCNLDKEYISFLQDKNYMGEIKDNKYYAYGKSCHAMIPSKGFNANFILMHFLNTYLKNDITEFLFNNFAFDYNGEKLGIDVYDEHMGDLSINAGVFNTVDSLLKISFDCRIPVNNHKQVIASKLDEALKDVENVSYELSRDTPLHFVDPNSSLVKTLMSCYQEITNDYTTKPFTIGGGTYAKFIKNCVAFGPQMINKPDVIHQSNEYMVIDELAQNIAIYAKSIYELIK